MSIEDFKRDMIESIERRVAFGVVLMSKKSFVEWTCAECAVTMLYRDRFNLHDSNLRYVDFNQMMHEVSREYNVLIVSFVSFVNAFDGEPLGEEWSPNQATMYNLGKEIRAKFNPVPYEELCGNFLATFK